jgi:hypothetical protein
MDLNRLKQTQLLGMNGMEDEFLLMDLDLDDFDGSFTGADLSVAPPEIDDADIYNAAQVEASTISYD